jgi:hypothetical protein
MRILFSSATDVKRYSVHPTAQRILPPRDATTPIVAKNMPMIRPTAASSADIFGMEKRYGKR